MVLLFITDSHGRDDAFDRLPAADVAILGGDLTQFGTSADVARVLAAAAARFPRVLAVLGNCDPPEGEGVLQSAGVALHRRLVRLGAVSLIGLGGSNRTPFHTPNEWSDAEMTARFDEVPLLAGAGPLVLVSHAPPLGSGADRLPNGVCAGSAAVSQWVRAHRPALVLCGHIHEAVGQFVLDGVPVVNPGAFRAGRYAVVTILPGAVAPVVELQALP